MRKAIVVVAALAVAVVPTASQAGFTLGGRTGIGFAMGDAYELNSEAYGMFDDFVAMQIPFQLDLGYRINPAVELGGYFSLGLGIPGENILDECDQFDLDCTAYAVRLGVQASYAWVKPGRVFAPWVGGGIGYEWAGYSMEGFGATYEEDASGFELNLQVGGDFKVSRIFAFGPYVMFSFGQYSAGTASASGLGEVDIFDFADEAWHQWLTIGIRGEFEFGAK